jgi:acetylornithine deacetylase/succinyl-diaminopimelate desuccinylase-like protein
MTDAAELTAELVRIPTVTGDEGDGAARIASLLRARGWTARVVADVNIVATIGPAAGSTALLAYLDTPPAGAMSDPFSGRLENGRTLGRPGPVVRGRGSATKAGLASAITAAERVARSNGVRLAATSRDNIGLAAVLDELAGARRAVHAEPTGLTVALEARGIVWLELIIEGRPAHAGSPAGATEPIGLLARAIDAARALQLPAHERLPAATLVPVELRSVREAPLTAKSATALFDRRLLPREDPEAARAELERVVRSALPDAVVRVSIAGGMRPYAIDREAPTVAALLRAARAIGGGEPALGAIPFATNAGLACASGIETVAYGPGRIGDLGDEEHVAVNEIAAAERILAAFLAEPA